jgi:hypothetical protein
LFGGFDLPLILARGEEINDGILIDLNPAHCPLCGTKMVDTCSTRTAHLGNTKAITAVFCIDIERHMIMIPCTK